MSESPSPAGKPVRSKRTFGPQDSLADEHDLAQGHPQPSRRPSGRVSFSAIPRRPSSLNRWRNGGAVEESQSPKSDKPAIPSALQPPAEAYATPLPTLSMIVLSITMLGEFLSANVSAPFLLFMVEGFHQFSDEADVGYWTGILVSTFFLTQFLTSLLWATVAAKHGSRTVLFVALLGSSVTCCLFGTATSLQQAMVIRLMQGVFAGAIGVARGSVTGITDQSNEGRAYAILGFCWGFGGVSGAIVGGTFENPANKWPGTFSKVPVFMQYPYLLPCAVAASVTFAGSMLSLFLGPDCGPREGTIRLSPEKPDDDTETAGESRPTTPMLEETEERGLVKKLSKKLSGYFSGRVHDAHNGDTSTPLEPPFPLSSGPSKSRTLSRSSAITGSAYGYTGAYRNRLASNFSLGTRRGSLTGVSIKRRGSNTDGVLSSVATGSDLNFAQRLLMANENAVTNIADLWVAAAMNVDNEDPFDSESEIDEALIEEDELDEADLFAGPIPSSHIDRFARRPSTSASQAIAGRSPHRSSLLGARHRSSSRQRRFSGDGTSYLAIPQSDEEALILPRRMSTTIAPIFSHVGVRTPPAVLEAQQLSDMPDESAGPADSLAPISESVLFTQDDTATIGNPVEEPSLMSQLPILVIVQYGLLALHSTTHDQVFYLYLVSKYPSGGLNLNAGHFSQLIALMCLAQIVYQFYFYPNIGPPRGRFSHLAMFRIGSLLYIPAYLSVILYRVFASASDDGNLVLMTALAFSTAIRYCGITFSYTAISVLLNYMSPPHIVGYANGIAQSIVSLARFFGPILGGLLWSVSVQDNPTGYPVGFLVCSGVCAVAIVSSYLIR